MAEELRQNQQRAADGIGKIPEVPAGVGPTVSMPNVEARVTSRRYSRTRGGQWCFES